MIRGNTIKEDEKIKVLNQIYKKIKEIEVSVPLQIKNAIDDLVNEAPEALDTLKEIVDNFIQSDWNQNDNTKLDYIKNRICSYSEQINERIIDIAEENDVIDFDKRLGYKLTGNKIQFYVGDNFIFEATAESFQTTVFPEGAASYVVTRYKAIDDIGEYVQIFVKRENTESRWDTFATGGLVDYIGTVAYTKEGYNGNGENYGKILKIKFTEKIETINKIDVKYIPDTIIQKIETLEQKVEQLEQSTNNP